MLKPLSIINEHFREKKWSFLAFGSLVGLLALIVIQLMEQMDLSGLAAMVDLFPEGMLDFVGGIVTLSTPYGFLGVEIFSFLWMYLGIFLIYMASSTALPAEVENKTIDLILSKPISRSSYLTGKISFLFLYIAGLMGIVLAFIGVGMVTSSTFIDFGLYWDRLFVTYVITVLHLGTLVMTAILFATIFLNTKKTMGAATVVMFVMFFIGSFWQYFPEDYQFIKYATTWFYYNVTDLFALGIFDNFLRDALVLSGVNVVLIIASLLIFRRRDIPV